MIFDRHQIERIKQANPVEEVIASELGDLKKAGKDFKALCPFHQEKTPSFTVSPKKQIYHCFGCGSHGDVVKWIMERHKMRFQEALQHLAARAGVPI